MWQAQVSAAHGGKMFKDMPTLDGKWKEAEKIRLLNMVRSCAVPVGQNPELGRCLLYEKRRYKGDTGR